MTLKQLIEKLQEMQNSHSDNCQVKFLSQHRSSLHEILAVNPSGSDKIIYILGDAYNG